MSDLDRQSFESLYGRLYAEVNSTMSKYDGSHDMTHIQRVTQNAEQILRKERETNPGQVYDERLVFFGTLMHDIGDGKYALPGQDISRMVYDMILENAPESKKVEEFASAVQTISTGVSHSHEMKNRQRVQDWIAKFLELAIVQDADRLDSIGAAGIGRTFTYSGSHEMRMQASRDLFDTKLFSLVNLMKTSAGKQIAIERTRRLQSFADWWDDETRTDPVDDLAKLSARSQLARCGDQGLDKNNSH